MGSDGESQTIGSCIPLYGGLQSPTIVLPSATCLTLTIEWQVLDHRIAELAAAVEAKEQLPPVCNDRQPTSPPPCHSPPFWTLEALVSMVHMGTCSPGPGLMTAVFKALGRSGSGTVPADPPLHLDPSVATEVLWAVAKLRLLAGREDEKEEVREGAALRSSIGSGPFRVLLSASRRGFESASVEKLAQVIHTFKLAVR